MKRLKRIALVPSILGLAGFSWPLSWMNIHTNPEAFGTSAWISKQEEIIKSQTSDIDQNVLHLSLVAYMNARKRGLDDKGLLTVVDYSKPSVEKRFWVFDIKNGRTLYDTWVSHGKNSGGLNAYSFSNSPGSLKSSIGLFLTANPYVGGQGYSLRLKGLEHGVNDNAYRRDIVVHGAWYVSKDTIRHYGQLGRSWGCLALNDSLSPSIINTIKDNTLIFAYYPDRRWLSHSKFLMS